MNPTEVVDTQPRIGFAYNAKFKKGKKTFAASVVYIGYEGGYFIVRHIDNYYRSKRSSPPEMEPAFIFNIKTDETK